MDPVILQGYLRKQCNSRFTKYKKRWCVLSAESLVYYIEKVVAPLSPHHISVIHIYIYLYIYLCMYVLTCCYILNQPSEEKRQPSGLIQILFAMAHEVPNKDKAGKESAYPFEVRRGF